MLVAHWQHPFLIAGHRKIQAIQMPKRQILRLETLEARHLLASVSEVAFSEVSSSSNELHVRVRFDSEMVGWASPSNYLLQRSNVDGIVGQDDSTLTPSRVEVDGLGVDLYFSGQYEPDLYRVTVKDLIKDKLGRRIDGDRDGTPGGDSIFSVILGGDGVFGFDTKFSGGTVRFDAGGRELARKIDIQPNGKYLVSGSSAIGQTLYTLIARYDSNGKLDRSFNQTGYLLEETGWHGTSHVLQTKDGGYLLVYGRQEFREGFYLRKYNSDGTLDTKFGSNGKTPVTSTVEFLGSKITTTPDGKLLVTGTNRQQTNAAMMQLNSDGSVDTSFGNQGTVTKPSYQNDSLEYGSSSAILSDSRILLVTLVAENPWPYERTKLVATVYDKFGKVDSRFGNQGSVEINPEPTAEGIAAREVTVDSKNRILLGSIQNFRSDDEKNPNVKIAVTRISPTGEIDRTFGKNGHAVIDSGSTYANLASLVVTSSGKILALYEASITNANMQIARLNDNGSLDNAFGKSGIFIVDTKRFGSFPSNTHVALDPLGGVLTTNGELVVAGTVTANAKGIALQDLILAQFDVSTTNVLLNNRQNEAFTVVPRGWGTGQLLYESSSLNRLTVDGKLFETNDYTFINSYQTVATAAMTTNDGVQVSRRVTVPYSGRDSFLQTIDSFHNPNFAIVQTSAQLTSTFLDGSKRSVFATSDGDTLIEPTDYWVGFDDENPDGGLNPIVQVFRSDFVDPAASVYAENEDLGWNFTLAIPPGKTVSLATFVVPGSSRQDAIRAAQRILNRDSESTALQFLRDDEIEAIVNFRMNHPPKGIQLSKTSIVENSPLGSVVADIVAIDQNLPFGDEIVYALDSSTGVNDNAAFRIINDQLITNTALDFEAKSRYSVGLRATDRAGLSFVQTVSIEIRDENEVIDVNLSQNVVSASDPIGTTVGRFSVQNASIKDAVSYALITGQGDEDNSRFKIVDNQLITTALLDDHARQGTEMSIRIAATSQGGLLLERIFNVRVLRTKNSPKDILLSNNLIRARSIGTIIGEFETVDQDAQELFRYDLVSGPGGADNANFSVDGKLLRLKSLQITNRSELQLRVRSTDHFGQSIEKAFVIYIVPTVVNDSGQTSSGSRITIDVVQNDLNTNSFHVELIQDTNSVVGSFLVLDDRRVEFVSPKDFEGVATAKYKLVSPLGIVSDPGLLKVAVSRSRLQNAWNNLDVNGDDRVSATDALMVINALNAIRAVEGEGGQTPLRYVDVSGDLRISPIDALLVIDFLNARPEPEGEAFDFEFDLETNSEFNRRSRAIRSRNITPAS